MDPKVQQQQVIVKQEQGEAARCVGSVKFEVVCKALNEIKRSEKRGSRDVQHAVLSGLFRRLASVAGREKSQMNNNRNTFVPSFALDKDDAYMVLRLLAPEVDRERSWYGLKEIALAKEYVAALNLSKSSAERRWLLNFSDRDAVPTTHPGYAKAVSGSFTSVLEAVLKERCPKQGSLTIQRVNELLDLLVKNRPVFSRRMALAGMPEASVGKERDDQIKREDFTDDKEQSAALRVQPQEILSASQVRTTVFRELIHKGSAEENVWVTRIILKNLEARLGYEKVLEWYNPSGLKAYKQTHSLRTVVDNCSDPTYNIVRPSVSLGFFASVLNTARPSRRGLEEVASLLKFRDNDRDDPPSADDFEDRYFFMEPKIDGERLVVHKIGKDVMTFSRNANSTTHIYGVMLKEAIEEVVMAQDVILDGEVFLLDKTLGAIIKFEEMRKKIYSFLRHETLQSEQLVLKYCVFDVLYVDQGKEYISGGLKPEDVLHLSCEHRRTILNSIIKPMPADRLKDMKYDSVIEVIQTVKGRTADDLKYQLENFVNQRYEGLIAKNCAMPYVLGERNPKFASKLKPDYFEGGIVDIDVLILGSKFGKGTSKIQRMGTLSSFYIGVIHQKDPSEDEGEDHPCSFLCIGTIGTGYSFDELRLLQDTLEPHWQHYDPEHELPWCDFSSIRPSPDRVIDPRNSVVLTVKAVELYQLKDYKLRFPRVERIRYDKAWTDTITLEELKEVDMNKNPLIVAGDEGDDDNEEGHFRKKIRRDTSTSGSVSTVRGRNAMRCMKPADTTNVEVKQCIFSGMSFLVHGSMVIPEFKADTECKIVSLGGAVVQKMNPEVTYMIADSSRNTHVKIWENYINQARQGNKAAMKGLQRDGGDRSILSVTWIARCEKRGGILPPLPADVIHASAELKAELDESYDLYGDHWRDPSTCDSLTESFRTVEKVGARRSESSSISVTDLAQIDQLIHKTLIDAGLIFHGLHVFVHGESLSLSNAKHLLRYFGARIVESGESKGPATHILVASHDSDGLRNVTVRGKLVSPEWVKECVAKRQLLPTYVKEGEGL